MTLRTQITIWLLLAGLSILFIWVFRGILLPFIVGLLLAYLLDPIADWLGRRGLSRLIATILILAVAVGVFLLLFFLLVPLIVQQLFGLLQRAPGYIDQLQEYANALVPELRERLGAQRVAEIENGLSDLVSNSIGIVGNLTTRVAQSGLTIINALGLLIVTPVVAFYLLLDWNNIIERADGLLPREHRDEIRKVFKDIDIALAGFIRGQSGVVLILAAFYATTLSLVGLNYGLAIGLAAGFFSFIPYVGFLIGFVLSLGVAIVQFWPDWPWVAAVLGIFLVGQFLEGNILYPKLVGSSIGVHAVWLMFALFAFALLFGVLGVLLAVPLAAIAGVLVRYAVRRYKASSLYGPEEPATEAVDDK
ncbi:MAG TPA: AI-2E family transporter [Devosiaceae bacterium]|nr:AI-2E family transporter [Devosiaceae bacterium]